MLKPGFVAANREALDKVAAHTGPVRGGGRLRRRGPRPAQRRRRVRRRPGGRDVPQAASCRTTRCSTSSATSRPATGPLELYEIAGVKVGVAICEDVWSPEGPIAEQSAGGAELVVIPNGSPYFAGRQAERERMVATRAEDAHCHIVYVNQVGGPGRADLRRRLVRGGRRRRPRGPARRSCARSCRSSTSTCGRSSAPGCSTPGAATPRPPLPGRARLRPDPTGPPPRRPPGPRRRSWPTCSNRWPRSTRPSCSPRTTTSPRTASPTSSSACRAASTPRSSP